MGKGQRALTAEDWAVMDAVERCPVWRALKALNLLQREKLLAAMCLVIQESVEGNEERSTIHGVEEFRDWGRRWGQDEPEAQLLLQHQWDNLLRHVMGITAAVEVWEPSAGEAANVVDYPQVNTSGGVLAIAERAGQMYEDEEQPQNTTVTTRGELLPNRRETTTDRCKEKEGEQADRSERVSPPVFVPLGENFHQCKKLAPRCQAWGFVGLPHTEVAGGGKM